MLSASAISFRDSMVLDASVKIIAQEIRMKRSREQGMYFPMAPSWNTPRIKPDGRRLEDADILPQLKRAGFPARVDKKGVPIRKSWFTGICQGRCADVRRLKSAMKKLKW